MGLCFCFVLETVFIIQDFFFTAEQYLHTDESFTASHPTPSVRKLGMHREWGGDTARTADPKWPKGAFHTIWHQAQHIKRWKKKEEGDTFGVIVFAFPNHCYTWWRHFPGDRWTPACVWEVVKEFLVFFHVQLLHSPLNSLYLNILLLFWSLPISLWVRGLWSLVAGWD